MKIAQPKIPCQYQIKIQDKTPNGFPKKFFALTLVGSSRAGKTTCILHLIQNCARTYENIVIFSPSADSPEWTSLKKLDNVYMSSIVSNNILNNLFEQQKILYRSDKTKNHMLLILDDFGILAKENGKAIGAELKEPELVSSGIRQMLDLLYSRARHNGISILCSLHDTKQLTPLQRVNTTHWILYRLNEKQYEKISGEIRCHLSEKEFVKLAENYTIQPYHALYVDLKSPTNEGVFKELEPEKVS